MAAYSINELLKIYEKLELEIIENMKKHLTSMKLSGVRKSDIARWEASQKSQLASFRRKNREIIKKYNKILSGKSKETMIEIYKTSRKRELERLIRNYGKTAKFKAALSEINLDKINALNDRRLIALLNAVSNDTSTALSSIYRKMDDIYRETIHDAAVNFNTGNMTMTKAIDKAQSDFLKKGITSITYASGAEVNIRSYAEMALRTNGQRAIIQGEAVLRDYLGINTIRVSQHGITCEKCAKWQGKILIDDVYQDGEPEGGYPLLSDAINQGLLHPNCRHSLMTIDPEIDGGPRTIAYTAKDKEKYEVQQKQRRLEREIRELKREAAGLTSPTAVKLKRQEILEKSKELNKFIEDHDYLIRQRDREKI